LTVFGVTVAFSVNAGVAIGSGGIGTVVVVATVAGDTVTTALGLVCVQSGEPVKSFAMRAIVLQVYGVATATLGAVAVKTSLIVSAGLLPLVRLSRWLFAVERNWMTPDTRLAVHVLGLGAPVGVASGVVTVHPKGP
jgi:hypothetical protein